MNLTYILSKLFEKYLFAFSIIKDVNGMQILNLILQNFAILCLLIGLGIIIISNKNFDKKTNLIFSLLVLIIIILVTEGILDQYFSKLPHPSILRYVVSATGYTLRPFVIVLFITVSLRREKHSLVLWLPMIFLAILSFTDYFTNIMFWYTEDNEFLRGPLAYSAHVISGIYLIIFLLIILIRHKNITNAETFAIFFSSFICFVAAVLETVLDDYKFLITDAMAVSSAIYYIVLYAETFRMDELTGLLNRRSLYINVKKKSNKRLVIISADLNGLKEINDTKGHLEGDRALKVLAETLLEESENKYVAYRTGGDEFILIGQEQTDTEINLFLDNVRNKLKKKSIMASFGYALYRPGESFDDVCNQADAQMYKDKRNYRSRTSNL